MVTGERERQLCICRARCSQRILKRCQKCFLQGTEDTDRQLNETEQDHIDSVLPRIIPLIDLTMLLSVLFSNKVITNFHMSSIKSRESAGSYAQAEKLMDIISRRSFKQYTKFILSLFLTGQGHIVNLIQSDEGTIFVRPYYIIQYNRVFTVRDKNEKEA